MPDKLTNDDTYDLIFYLVAPTHPQSVDYLNDTLNASLRLYDLILAEYTKMLGHNQQYVHRGEAVDLKRTP